MINPDEIPNAWRVVLEQANDLDEVIRKALRPAFDRLKSDAPNIAAAMSIAMICHALRMLDSEGNEDERLEFQSLICQLSLTQVAQHPEHP